VRARTIVALLLLLALAPASALGAPVTLPGSPLSVSVGPLGQCQSSYPGAANDFYPSAGALGDCGFFLGFPEAGNPPLLARKVFGFEGARGPRLQSLYSPLSQSAVSGSGSAADPYVQLTSYEVSDPAKAKEADYAVVRQTTTYINGSAQFTASFDVENVTGQAPTGAISPAPSAALRFHAIYAGDLLVGGSEFAGGLLSGGPPRLVGGEAPSAGALVAFSEAPSPSPQWSSYESGCWNVVPEPEGRCPTTNPTDGGIWAAVRAGFGEGPVFNDAVDPNVLDDGAGVSWDDRLASPLKPGEHAIYSIVDRADTPRALVVAPPAQTVTVGRTATILLTATDSAGMPYANRPVVYTIGPANPKSGSVLTSPAGVATISYTGTAAGADTLQAFLDLSASGVASASDPAASARVAWTPATAAANSHFTLRSVHVAKGGAVTVVLVPRQEGRARVEVTVPTASVALGRARAKRPLACARGEIAIGRSCRPRTTVSGKVTGHGRGGVASTFVVKPSRSLRLALARGRNVSLTVRIGYRSRLGGNATNENFKRVARGRRRRHGG
jgi:hypothetical protein